MFSFSFSNFEVVEKANTDEFDSEGGPSNQQMIPETHPFFRVLIRCNGARPLGKRALLIGHGMTWHTSRRNVQAILGSNNPFLD